MLERCHRTLDETRTVVGDGELHPFRKACLELLDLLLDPIDDVEGVLAVPHDDDAADALALAVPFEKAATDFGAETDGRNVPNENRRSSRARRAQGDLLDPGEILDIAAPAHVVLAL